MWEELDLLRNARQHTSCDVVCQHLRDDPSHPRSIIYVGAKGFAHSTSCSRTRFSVKNQMEIPQMDITWNTD
jgi:hypothetical protein